MVGVLTWYIYESPEVLKALMDEQTEELRRAKLHALYLLKSGTVKTKKQLAQIMLRNESTLFRWYQCYEREGLEGLLNSRKNPPGVKPKLQGKVREHLTERLADPAGFNNFSEVQAWVEQECGVSVSYPTSHRVVRYELKAKLKVPRPRSKKASCAQQEDFKKNSMSG